MNSFSKAVCLLAVYAFSINFVNGQYLKDESFNNKSYEKAEKNIVENRKWYDIIKINGYIQARYNGLFETNPDLAVEQADKNWGKDKGISFRRIRVKLSGWLHPKVYMYVQGDFASEFSLKDAYGDFYADNEKKLWLRVGQSKVPYGFENMQSSQHRIVLDRNDPFNSALKNERDMMAVAYYTPVKFRKVYDYLKRNNLKHSGNYGAFGLGVFNGQTANTPDENDEMHIVARTSYPLMLPNKQVFEFILQAYSGNYVVTNTSEGVKTTIINNEGHEELIDANGAEFEDSRIGAGVIWYPQPFGLQAEYNIGRGPEYDPSTNTIKVQDLHGGYIMAMGKIDYREHSFFPFIRYQFYDGGKKFELDARSYTVDDWEIGLEWQPMDAMEVTAMYVIADRRYEDGELPENEESGNLLRLQMQLNF
ncbi:porin [Aureibacter tunicatorum]|uniref:Porin n=1 Tax=Aureibacter tunicatorum TaxID=866807 RepID=A0AAE3XN63_9BACT|nr:porin [Aureibacter tunicatorum]MDR6238964.1 hypothetical protein [Aureibacter tunicatorum]